MSLKSFDKFCERMILSEPQSQKDIFDERQNQIRSKLLIESLIVFACFSSLMVLVMEASYQWCESYVAVLMLTAALCYLWWVLRNLYYGSLFGVRYTQTHYTACVMIAECLIFTFLLFDDYILGDNEDQTDVAKDFFINDGRLSEDIVICVALAVMLISSVIILFAVHRKKKEEAAEEKSSE